MKMKKYFAMMMMAVVGFCLTACSDSDDDAVKLVKLTVQVSGVDDLEDFDVELTNTTSTSSYTATTDANGVATFSVTPGVYNATVSETRYVEGYRFVYNGTASNITLTADKEATATIVLKEAISSQVIIKEVYNGGCPKDEGTGAFQQDKCIILYNNTSETASLSNLCIAYAAPYNGHTNNKNYGENGKLTYESEGFIPAYNGMWWFQGELVVKPYSQVVVNVAGAIDNTQTYSQSVNYANADYYAMYDPESGFTNSSWYPTPSVIPTSHYLKAKRIGLGNAWSLSNTSPAIIIFQTNGTTPAAFAEDADLWYDGGGTGAVNACHKVKNEWILDGMEVYQTAKIADSKKRLTSDIDAGYVGLTNQKGHVLYRNVDKEATEALAENAGKLVYNYALGFESSTDPSGIDAEASMKKGAHIIFKDTNNSTVDFHERQKCSLRD